MWPTVLLPYNEFATTCTYFKNIFFLHLKKKKKKKKCWCVVHMMIQVFILIVCVSHYWNSQVLQDFKTSLQWMTEDSGTLLRQGDCQDHQKYFFPMENCLKRIQEETAVRLYLGIWPWSLASWLHEMSDHCSKRTYVPFISVWGSQCLSTV